MLENLERSQRFVGQTITAQLHTTPVEDIQAGENHPTIKTWAIQLSTIIVEKSLRTTLLNPRHIAATQWVRQHTQKLSWREKVGNVWRKSLAIPNQPGQTHLSPHGLTPAPTPLSQPDRRRATLYRATQ